MYDAAPNEGALHMEETAWNYWKAVSSPGRKPFPHLYQHVKRRRMKLIYRFCFLA